MENNVSPSLWDSILSLGKELTSGSGAWTQRNRTNSDNSSRDATGTSDEASPPVVQFQHHSELMHQLNHEKDEEALQSERENQRVRDKQLERRKSDYNLKLQTYVVQKGDTLNSLSLRFDMPVNQIKRVNHLFNSNLFKGQQLQLQAIPENASNETMETKSTQTLKSDSSASNTTPLNTKLEASKALLCLGDRRIHGEVVVTTYCVMFEPSESDAHVIQSGLMEYQFCVDLRDVKGCGSVSSVSKYEDDPSKFDDNSIMSGAINVTTIAEGDGYYVDVGSSTEYGNDDVSSIDHLPANQLRYFQVVWSSDAMGCFEDSSILFLVPKDASTKLVEFTQQVLLNLSKSRNTENRSPRSPRANATLTSGKPLVHGGALRCSFVPAVRLNEETDTTRSSMMGKKTASMSEIDNMKNDSPRTLSDDSLVEEHPSEETTIRVPKLLPSESNILSIAQIMEVTLSLPSTLQSYNWRRLYGFDADGVSLGTLFERVSTTKPTLLVIKTTDNDIVGCYNAVSWEIANGHSFYGSGEMFLFSFIGTKYNVFRWTGENDFFISSGQSHLGIGGGGDGFALMLDAELCNGSSNASCTFSNQGPITQREFFQVADVEVYTFEFRQHDSHHQYKPMETRSRSLSNLLSEAAMYQ